MMRSHLNRYSAAAIHVALSATIACLVFITIYFLWFPGALFDSAGGRDLFLLVLAIDVTIGPLVTLIIFVPGKKGLRFDLWVIGVIQAGFLVYGLVAIAESRPVYIAFVKDRFEITRAQNIPDSVLKDAHMDRYRDLPWTGPRIVGVQFPTDPDQKFNMMISGMAGVDIQSYPQYHVPYESVRSEVVAHSAPLARLAKFNKGLSVEALAADLGRPQEELRFLPVRAGKVDLAMVVDAKSGDIVKLVELKPWEYE